VLRKCRFIGRPTRRAKQARQSQTPKMLGLDVPPRLFAHADGVIE
jgi:hypothetical protein